MTEVEVYVACVVAVLLAIGIASARKGRELRLIQMSQQDGLMHRSQLLRKKVARSVFYMLAGLVWFLSRVGVPGLELVATYGLDNRLGMLMRAAYWKARLRGMGTDVVIDIGARIICPRNISIGDNTWIDKYVILAAGVPAPSRKHVRMKKNRNFGFGRGELVIGRGCHLAPYVLVQAHGGCYIGDFTGIASGSRVYSLSSHYRGPEDARVVYKFTPQAPPEEQSLIEGSVVFEGNNALGLNVVVLPGVTIGKNSWVGVGSCVVKDIPADCIASGTPCKVTKRRFREGFPLPTS